jgi:Mg2+ and Co2+ transporter CorA
MLPNSETPLTAAVLPLKIVCAQYVKLIDYFEVILQRLARTEWRLSRQSDYLDSKYPEVEEQWSSLQLTRVRLSTYIDDLEEIIGDIAIPAAQSSSYSIPVEWQDIKKDFQYIHGCLQKMKGRVDEAITSAMGLSNIVGSKQALSEARRSVKEAKSTKTLTVVGLVFIPLAYTCALFSMSDQFRPGSSLFWVYFAVSVPLIVLVFAGTFLIQLGYDEGAAWSLGQFKKAWLGKTL